MRLNISYIGVIVIGIWAVSCSPDLRPGVSDSPITHTYAAKPSNFRVTLIDAPAVALTSVFVNIARLELWVEYQGAAKRILLGQETGSLDLMLLRNGVTRTIQDFHMPDSVIVKEIRLVLHGDGNYAVKTDGSNCSLQTPSGQQSGVKIKLSQPVTIQPNSSYSLVVDFDALKSVVVKGNGDCLLKPVLKLAGFNRVDVDQVDDEGGQTEDPGEEVGGDDGSNGEFDETDPTTWPPGYEPGTGFLL